MSNFITVDVETSGLDPRTCSILSIGAIKRKSKEEYYGECSAWNGATVDNSALAVNGFTVSDCLDTVRKNESQLINEFLLWVGYDEPAVIIGMNPHFDFSFIRAAADRAGIKKIPLTHRTIDMHTMAIIYALKHKYEIPAKGYYTDAIYKMIGMAPEPKPHNALTGAQMENDALQKLLTSIITK